MSSNSLSTTTRAQPHPQIEAEEAWLRHVDGQARDDAECRLRYLRAHPQQKVTLVTTEMAREWEQDHAGGEPAA